MAREMEAQSGSLICPVRTSCELMRASEQRIRWISCSAAISRLNRATLVSALAALTAILSASAVLPTAGRAARMMRSPRCKPARDRIEVVEASRHAGDLLLLLEQFLELLEARAEQIVDLLEVVRDACSGHVEDELLCLFDNLLHVVRSVIADSDDLGRCGDQIPEHRRPTHDLCVPAGVGGRRNNAGHIQEIGLAPGLLELPALSSLSATLSWSIGTLWSYK